MLDHIMRENAGVVRVLRLQHAEKTLYTVLRTHCVHRRGTLRVSDRREPSGTKLDNLIPSSELSPENLDRKRTQKFPEPIRDGDIVTDPIVCHGVRDPSPILLLHVGNF